MSLRPIPARTFRAPFHGRYALETEKLKTEKNANASEHSDYMKRALALAGKGRDEVSPNPMVGALIVRNGEILGEGYHARYGDIHAEEAALRDCRKRGHNPAGADLYVTLEPCSFSAKDKHNGPCTEKIRDARIARVFVASVDPNPRVAGRGIRFLEDQGIEVVSGILAAREERLNEVYRRIQAEGRPFVELKAALTADGFLAARDGSSRWISCDLSRERVMEMRALSDAVLVGGGTLRADRPSLTVRDGSGNLRGETQPRRVILSRRGTLPEAWPCEGGEILIYCDEPAATGSDDPEGTQRIAVPRKGDELDLDRVLKDLFSRGVRRLLVEGGGRIYRSFLKTGLWDRLTLFQAPDFLGEGVPFAGNIGIGSMDKKIILAHRESCFSGRDLMIRGYRSVYESGEGPCSQD